MQVAGEKRVASENDAVNAISALVYRPGKGDGRVHPVVARQPAKGDRTAIGVVEEVVIRGSKGDIRVLARVDTGAARTSLDTDLALRAGLGPVFDRVREFDVAVAITDRKDMRYHMIVGMDVLREAGFLVDPSKGNERENNTKRAPPTG